MPRCPNCDKRLPFLRVMEGGIRGQKTICKKCNSLLTSEGSKYGKFGGPTIGLTVALLYFASRYKKSNYELSALLFFLGMICAFFTIWNFYRIVKYILSSEEE